MKSTKKSLALSILSLVICVAMLLGTTFAWFTDSVTSGVNKIVAGNLDIELEALVGGEWIPVTNATKLFDDEALWEPGHTEAAYLKLSNVGTLALKYNLAINVANEVEGTNVAGDTFKLSDYLYMGIVDGRDTAFESRDAARAAVSTAGPIVNYAKAGEMLPTEDLAFAVVVYMPETVGNEANYKTGTTAPSIELGINVAATQLAHEADSFGDDYDENLILAGEEFASKIAAAATDGTVTEIWLENDIALAKGGVAVPSGAKLVIHGEGHNVAFVDRVLSLGNNKTADITIENAKFEGSKLSGCYAVVTAKNYNGETKISNCTFDNMMCAVYADDSANTPAKLTLTNNDFSGALYSYSLGNNTTTNNKTVTYEHNIDGIFGEQETFGAGKMTRVVDGVYKNAAGDTFSIVGATGLTNFAGLVNRGDTFAGKKVVLANDIDLAGKAWTPIGSANTEAGKTGDIFFAGAFDGQNHTIKNLKVTGAHGQRNLGLFGVICTENGADPIENLTIDGAEIIGDSSAVGVLAGQAGAHWHTSNEYYVSGQGNSGIAGIKNITIKNATVKGAKYVGALVGYCWENLYDIVIDNCTVEALYVDGFNAYDPTYVSGRSDNDSAENAGGATGDGGNNSFINENIKVTNTTVTGKAKVGAIGGSTRIYKIVNCDAEDCVVNASSNSNVSELFGRYFATVYEDNDATNVTVNIP